MPFNSTSEEKESGAAKAKVSSYLHNTQQHSSNAPLLFLWGLNTHLTLDGSILWASKVS